MEMKKWISWIVALVMMMSMMSVTALAGDVLTVGDGEDDDYATIQEAINYINTQSNKENWTIIVKEGTYARFTVLNGMNNLTVKAADGASVVIETLNGDTAPAETSDAVPNTAGVSIRQANNVTLEGLKFDVGTQADPWYSAAVSNYTQTTIKGNNIIVKNCIFEGSGSTSVNAP